MALSRRSFLALAGAGTAATLFMPHLQQLYARASSGQSVMAPGYGALQSDPDGLLDLPPGFRYRVLSPTGERMSDGNPVPGNHDGMAAFAGPDGNTLLIRNHELSPNDPQRLAVIAPEALKYDSRGRGGTTTLVVGRDRELLHHQVSLAGTCRNCAGGPTPWQSWLSCEEDTSTPAQTRRGAPDEVFRKHGYIFEVPTQAQIARPEPLIAMGRFRHEAVAIDPTTGDAYETEDQVDGCFYRFRPHRPGRLDVGGRLEALALPGQPRCDTGSQLTVGQSLPVEWVPIEQPDPEEDTLRDEAQAKGAAIFRRGEGIWYGNRSLYFTCTIGGKAGKGQIFRYAPHTGTLELMIESPGAGVLDHPDNLVVAPWGDLILCEDGGGEQFLVGVTSRGDYYPLARNALNTSELAGVCFSPDRTTLFVNLYMPGMTFAIWGPWI